MTLPEAEAARIMAHALDMLRIYYGQSKNKRAVAMVARLNAAYPEGTTITPDWVAPRDAHEKEDERHDPVDTPGLRRHYWMHALRPLLADPTLFVDMRRLTLELRDMMVSTTERDNAVDVLRQCVVYFDLYFGLVTQREVEDLLQKSKGVVLDLVDDDDDDAIEDDKE